MQILNNKSKNTYIYCFILFLYVLLVFIVGFHHEPWPDEAQSWLIARDHSYADIFFVQTRYEGHPFIWYFIEKGLIDFCSLFTSSSNAYNWIFILPLAFSALGIYLFLFRSKFPLWFKIVFPFTFYTFYQYGIISRSHALYFPVIAAIAALYPKRFEHPFVYALFLFICANISAYSFVVSFVLLIFFFIEAFLNRKTLNIKKLLFPSSVLLLCLIFIAVLMQKPTDTTVQIELILYKEKLLAALHNIAEIYFPIRNSGLKQILLGNLFVLVFYLSVMKAYCKNLYQTIFFLCLNLPLFALYIILYIQPWHYGYAIYTLLFCCWIFTGINDIKSIPVKNNFILYACIIFILIHQTVGNIIVSWYDINNNYGVSKVTADLIKKYNLQDYKINGLGFKSVGVQPYFEKNIYYNYKGATHFFWEKEFADNYQLLSREKTPIIIVDSTNCPEVYSEEFLKSIEDDYYIYYLSAESNGLNFKYGSREDNSYHFYIDKNLAQKIGLEAP